MRKKSLWMVLILSACLMLSACAGNGTTQSTSDNDVDVAQPTTVCSTTASVTAIPLPSESGSTVVASASRDTDSKNVTEPTMETVGTTTVNTTVGTAATTVRNTTVAAVTTNQKTTVKAESPESTTMVPTSTAAVTFADPVDILMTDDSIMLGVGYTWKIKFSVTPSGADVSKIAFSSSDPTIATVSSDGIVTGCAGGEVSITAKLPNGKTGTLSVEVIGSPKTDSETLADAMTKKGIKIPSTASIGKLENTDVKGEYAIWAGTYSSGATITPTADMSITVTVCVKVNYARNGKSDTATIAVTRGYASPDVNKTETISVKSGDLIYKTYSLNLFKGGKNGGYHVSLDTNGIYHYGNLYNLNTLSANWAVG